MRATVRRWVRAWEDGDVDGLVAMLVDDAGYAMPPAPTWYRGREDVRRFLRTRPHAPGRRWRVAPTRVNGQLAFIVRRPDGGGGWSPHAVEVVTLAADGRVAEVVAFLDPAQVARVTAAETPPG